MENKSYKFNDKTYQEYKAKFEELDKDRKGFVNLNELDGSLVELFKQIDTNNDGRVSLDDYICYYEKVVLEKVTEDFKKHDHDGNGNITPGDLINGLGYVYYTAEIKCDDLDLNKDGRATIEDFLLVYFDV